MRSDRPCDPRTPLSIWRSASAIDLVVVGPEAPLVAGVADALRDAGIRGLRARAPRPPSSKGRKASPRICAAPTASRPPIMCASRRAADALAALDRFGIPVVIKADGLAAGKGVTVAMTRAEAEAAIEAAGDGPLVIEEFLEGEEASLFALVDGETAVAARLGTGPQARRRRRYRAEYRRNGRLCACPGPDGRARAARDGRNRPPDGTRAGRGGNAVQRRALCRPDADRRRTQADRI